MPIDEDPVISDPIVGEGMPVMISHLKVQHPSPYSLGYVLPPDALVFPGEDQNPAPQMI